IRSNFNLNKCSEFTFEAGRADCIDDEKLNAIKSSGADRICINAQSMHDETLDKIGRHIKIDRFYEAYEKALKYNFIKNVDLIYGLEGENEEMFLSSLDRIIALNPENITIHSLSYKRNSQIFENKNFISSSGFDKSYKILDNNNYQPYYLYRQKYTANGAENTGFSRPGYDGIYNRLIISERIGVIGLGAGAAGKIYDKQTDNIKRVAGYKNIDLYIKNTQDAIDKKRRTYGFI
ncbi:MAG: radical SAM protein, partial [Eubacteriaceae bacterium]|nr:radical SAM protein [Eubacteriaceae bacterium]